MERYKRENLDQNVGKVWNVLNENQGATLSKIEKVGQIKKDDILLVLGWLFREDKIGAERGKKTVRFYLK